MNNNTTKKQSFFIITAGPTGAGKSGVLNKTLSLIEKENNIKLKELPNNFDYKNNRYKRVKSKNIEGILEYKRFLIDDLVEQSPEYKKEVKELIYDECNKLDIDYCINDKEKLDKLIRRFEKIYFKIRGSWRDKNSLDNKLDKALQKSIANGDNIVFETTGLGPLNWLMDYITKGVSTEYNVILSYSLVEYCKLIERNKRRTVDSVKLLMENNEANAPRLPDVRDVPITNRFKKTVKGIKKTLLDIVDNNCVVKDFDETNNNINKKFCGNHPINSLLLSNNNPDKNEKKSNENFIFDSNKNKFNKRIIKKYINKHMTIIGEDSKKTFNSPCPTKDVKYTFDELISDYKINELKLIAKRNGVKVEDIVGKKTKKTTWATAIMFKSTK